MGIATSRAWRTLAIAAAVLSLGVALAPAAQAHGGSPFPARLELPPGFQPEGITTGRGTTVYVGSLRDGAIWRRDVRSGSEGTLVNGIAGRVAVGIDFEKRAGRLWVAGGATGTVTAYDARTGAELARYTTAGSGFLNDLVVTRHAVYVTDSTVQRLVVIPLGEHGALPGQSAVRTLALTGAIAYTTGFNANGIVAIHGGRTLILVQSNTSKLFRVDAATGVATEIAVTGGALQGGDGLELRGRTLYVVRAAPNAIVAVRLGRRATAGRIVRTLTAPAGQLDVPSTATFVGAALYAVNARFGTPPGPAVPYWVTRVAKK